MTRRYFVPNLPAAGGTIPLPDQEAQHAIRVMRVHEGDEIVLFDGSGNESSAAVKEIKRQSCICFAEPPKQINCEAPADIEMGIALPKPDRAKEMIERLTELGVAAVVPLVAERTQRPPSPALIGKLQRCVIEGCKQSGRNRLLKLREPMKSNDYFGATRRGARLFADPSPSSLTLRDLSVGPISVAIGPEGGWSESERRCAIESRFQAIHLGPRIYRIETAAAAIAATLVTP